MWASEFLPDSFPCDGTLFWTTVPSFSDIAYLLITNSSNSYSLLIKSSSFQIPKKPVINILVRCVCIWNVSIELVAPCQGSNHEHRTPLKRLEKHVLSCMETVFCMCQCVGWISLLCYLLSFAWSRECTVNKSDPTFQRFKTQKNHLGVLYFCSKNKPTPTLYLH